MGIPVSSSGRDGRGPTPAPRAARPRRIALLGWAQLSLQARQGTGYNLYASELATGLAQRGHDVVYLRSGLDYAPFREPHVRFVERWRGVACHHLYNSPNLSPAAANFLNMQAERSSPELVRVVMRWLDSVGAEIVHVQSLEGLSLDLPPAIRESGRALVVTPHNYWYLCPQVDLLRGETELCEDYEGGLRCVGCTVEYPDPAKARRRRAMRQTIDRFAGGSTVPAIRARMAQLRHRIRQRLAAPGAPASTPVAAPDVPGDLFRGFEPGPDGTFDHGLEPYPGELPELGACPIDQNERFLRAPHHLRIANEYGERRRAGIEAIGHADAVLAPSGFLRSAYEAMGVDRRILRTFWYGAPHFDRIHRRAVSSPFYDVRPWDPKNARRPLRFAYHGTTRNNKGLVWLIKSIPLLEPEVRQRCQFLIRAHGWDWPYRKLASPYPEVQFLGGYDPLQLLAAWGDYDVGILCHVWFDNLPLVMLEHLHGGKFVVSARLGGVVDCIVPPKNGLFYAAGHPEELAAAITQLVRGDVPIPSPREVHDATPLPSFESHVEELEAIYEDVLAKRAGSAAG